MASSRALSTGRSAHVDAPGQSGRSPGASPQCATATDGASPQVSWRIAAYGVWRRSRSTTGDENPALGLLLRRGRELGLPAQMPNLRAWRPTGDRRQSKGGSQEGADGAAATAAQSEGGFLGRCQEVAILRFCGGRRKGGERSGCKPCRSSPAPKVVGGGAQAGGRAQGEREPGENLQRPGSRDRSGGRSDVGRRMGLRRVRRRSHAQQEEGMPHLHSLAGGNN